MAIKPALPKGARDFLPAEMRERSYITEVISRLFEQYGYQRIETPALERSQTLTGKYGEEGDRLIFKIAPRGQKLFSALQKVADGQPEAWQQATEEALRYDLTVPFARFVVQHQQELTFPFKRYQIQPVWRADRPQKGRYREFTQCDADAVGSDSLLLDLELIAIYQEVFQELHLPVAIRLNHRKVLAGLGEALGLNEAQQGHFTTALDKLDKVGLAGVQKELGERGLPAAAAETVQQITALQGTAAEKIQGALALVGSSAIGQQGLHELNFLLEEARSLDRHQSLQLDFTLARGLDYYTGTILEVVPTEQDMGSLGGGGRYDDLTSLFGKPGLSGIGISFGLDRIQLALREAQLFPATEAIGTQVLFAHFGQREALYCLKLAQALRQLGVPTEVYPEAAKLKKQLQYAQKKNIPQVVLIGEEELKEGRFTLKNMELGQQEELSKIELLERFNPHAQRDYGKH